VHLSHQTRARELAYLREDLDESILSIQRNFTLECYDSALLNQIQEKLALLAHMHIGAPALLDSIQYLLGEIRTGVLDEDLLYAQLTWLIDQIQDYLDWVTPQESNARC